VDAVPRSIAPYMYSSSGPPVVSASSATRSASSGRASRNRKAAEAFYALAQNASFTEEEFGPLLTQPRERMAPHKVIRCCWQNRWWCRDFSVDVRSRQYQSSV
jgi:hypothetical protein